MTKWTRGFAHYGRDSRGTESWERFFSLAPLPALLLLFAAQTGKPLQVETQSSSVGKRLPEQPVSRKPVETAHLSLYRSSHEAMGTLYTMEIYARSQDEANGLFELAFDEVDRIDSLLSNYQPSSELIRITEGAPKGPITTDPETFRFLERSLFWSEESGGAFDITVGPLLKAWGFFFHGGRIPSDSELASLRKTIGWNKVLLDPMTRTVRFRDATQLDLDPGSIGKGFAVDRVVQLLRSANVDAALISAGGSTIYGIGAPPGEPGWTVNIPSPVGTNGPPAPVLLRDSSLSTGACTEKFFIKEGHRYCHIFNPQTMRPVEGTIQTTVIDPSATDSDALSTVVFVLGDQGSLALLSRFPEASALIFRDGSSGPRCIAIRWPSGSCSDLKTGMNQGVKQ